jgi:hypothetical protein
MHQLSDSGKKTWVVESVLWQASGLENEQTGDTGKMEKTIALAVVAAVIVFAAVYCISVWKRSGK